MNGVAVMKYRKFFCAFLLAAALLCACGQDRTAPNEPAPGPSDQAEAQPIFWNDLRWDEHLELVYAQSFAVDFAQYGFARITIDGIVYLLVPEDLGPPPDTPEDVVVLQQPLGNIYLQATAAMDCFRQLDAMDAVTLSGTQADGWYIPEAREEIGRAHV